MSLVLADVHDRGGLTRAHWAAITRLIHGVRVRRLLSPNSPAVKVSDYGKKVLLGQFPDRDFHHRRYLGRRHWQLMLSMFDKSNTDGLAQEIREYALFERAGLYTVDDLFAAERPESTQSAHIRAPWDGYLSWSGDKWEAIVFVTQAVHEGVGGYYTYPPESPDVEESRVRQTVLSHVHSHWLLDAHDVQGDALKAGPGDLSKMLRKRAAAEPERFRPKLWERGGVRGMRYRLAEEWQLSTATQTDAEDEQRRGKFQRCHQAHFGGMPYVNCPSDVESTFAVVEAAVRG